MIVVKGGNITAPIDHVAALYRSCYSQLRQMRSIIDQAIADQMPGEGE